MRQVRPRLPNTATKKEFEMPRIALFQDYLAQNGGAERVTEAIHQALPEADLHTSLAVPDLISPYLRWLGAKTTCMQALPSKTKLYRHPFLIYACAVESNDPHEHA